MLMALIAFHEAGQIGRRSDCHMLDFRHSAALAEVLFTCAYLKSQIMLRHLSLTCYELQVGHNPSALDFLADVANSAGNHVAGETSRGTAAAAVCAGLQPINGILKVRQNCYSW